MAKELTPEEIVRRRKKTISVKKLAEQIQGLRSKLTRDLKSEDEKVRLVALVLSIIDKTSERVGNEESASNGHVGVTGFQKKHVSIDGDSITFKYVGKSGVDHDKTFTDKKIAELLKKCIGNCKNKEDFLFMTEDGLKIKSVQINRYLEEYGVTAKDLRGYGANTLVVKMLKGRKMPKEESERKKIFGEVMAVVAEMVGHGKATLKKHYLLPHVEEEYVKKGLVKNVKDASNRLIWKVSHSNQSDLIRQLGLIAVLFKDRIAEVFEEKFHMESMAPEYIEFDIDELPEGKAGSYDHTEEILTLSPDSVERGKEYVLIVIAHEMIHAVIGKREDDHGELFNKVADEIGIPKRYRE